jgi:hypothetical protein
MIAGVVSGVTLGSGLISDAANASHAFPSYKSRAYCASNKEEWFMPEYARESPLGNCLQRLAFVGAHSAIHVGDNIQDRKAEEELLQGEIGHLSLVRKTLEGRVSALEASKDKSVGNSLNDGDTAKETTVLSVSNTSLGLVRSGSLQGDRSPLRRTTRPLRHMQIKNSVDLLDSTLIINENGLRYLFGSVAVRPPNLPTFSKDSRAIEVISTAHWQRVVAITDLLSVSCYLLWTHPFII